MQSNHSMSDARSIEKSIFASLSNSKRKQDAHSFSSRLNILKDNVSTRPQYLNIAELPELVKLANDVTISPKERVGALASLRRVIVFVIENGALLAQPGGTETGQHAGRKRQRNEAKMFHDERLCEVNPSNPRNKLAYWLRAQVQRAQADVMHALSNSLRSGISDNESQVATLMWLSNFITKAQLNHVSGRDEHGGKVQASGGASTQLVRLDQSLMDATVGTLAGASDEQLGMEAIACVQSELCDRYDDVRLSFLTAVRSVALGQTTRAAKAGSSGDASDIAGKSDGLTGTVGSKKSRSGDEEGAAGGASGSKFDQSKPSGVTSAVLASSDPEWVAVRLVQLMQCVQLPADDDEWGDRTFAVPQGGGAGRTGLAVDESAEAFSAGVTSDAAREARRRAKGRGKGKGGSSSEHEARSMAEIEADEKKAEEAASTGGTGTGTGTASSRGKLAGVEGQGLASRAGLLHEHRVAFEQAWLAVLRLPMPPLMMQRVLQDLPVDILPHCTQPLQFSDFLRDVVKAAPRYVFAVDFAASAVRKGTDGSFASASKPLSGLSELEAAQGTEEIELGNEDDDSPHGRDAVLRATCAILAVRSLFVLVRRHGLQHPRFFEELYSMLTPALARSPVRSAYFQVLAVFLKSAGLPAYLVAAFAKRLVRLALRTADPGVALFALPQAFNLVSKHPVLTPMIHKGAGARGRKEAVLAASQATGKDTIGAAGGAGTSASPSDDPFDELEDDPAKCGAINSQLWELVALREHWHPIVSARAAVFERDLARPPFEAGRFAGETYRTLLAKHREQLTQSLDAQRFADAGSLKEAGLEGGLGGEGIGIGMGMGMGMGSGSTVGSSLLRQLGLGGIDGRPQLEEGETMDENGLIAFARGLGEAADGASGGSEAGKKQMMALMQAAHKQLGTAGSKPTYGRRRQRTFGGASGTPVSQFSVGGLESGELVPALPTARAALMARRASAAAAAAYGAGAGEGADDDEDEDADGPVGAHPLLLPEGANREFTAAEQLELLRDAMDRAQEGVLPLQMEGFMTAVEQGWAVEDETLHMRWQGGI